MIFLLIEPLLLVLVAVAGPIFASRALDGSLAAATLRGEVGDAAALQALIQVATWQFSGAGVLLAAARAYGLFVRRGEHILAPFSLPAAYAALGLGFTLQCGYGSPFAASWPGPAFAAGVLYAGVVGAAILVLPGDIGAILTRGRWLLLGLAVVLVGLLAAFGTSPGHSGQTINLWGFQPIEIVKLCVAVAVGGALGARALKLRWHRVGPGWLRIPRPRLLLVATTILVAGWVALFAVHDFGPTLILAFVFLGLFYVVTRSPVWVFAAVTVTVLFLAGFWNHPDLAPSSTLALRLDMWRDPWLNARPNGDQLAMAWWAMGAGGWSGSGVGAGIPGALPAGHTDLIYAHLVEVLGEWGGVAYLTLLATSVADGLRVAAYNRTPERVMIAAALGLLLAGQAFVILGGTLGLFPLTGVVVPFLSFGKTGTVALLSIVTLLVRLGDDARYRADTEELRELRLGVQHLRVGLVALGLGLAVATAVRAVVGRDATTLRGVVTTLGDGTPWIRHDPRLMVLASQVRRGSILDRNGDALAESPTPGARVNPLGAALGTVLGPGDRSVARAAWQIERQLDSRLRGWPDLAHGPSVWLSAMRGTPQIVLAVDVSELPEGEEQAQAQARADARGATGPLRHLALTDADLSPLLALARMPVVDRAVAIRALGEDVASRSVTLTLDSKLQLALSAAAKQAAGKSKVGTAAVVVMNPDTGEVLARAQWPDFDPSSSTWRADRRVETPKFMGIYGAWSDKTGAHGVFQAGSVFKTLTAFLAIREGIVSATMEPGVCPASATPTFACDQVDGGRPSFTLPGWSRPVHDHGDGGAHGKLDLVEALSKSSNVYFSQLALQLGPEPYRRLRTDGVEFGNPGVLAEKDGAFTGFGERESRRLAQTGFGQGAGSWSVSQAARFVSAIANGGAYVRCPGSMELGVPCDRTELLPPGSSVAPLLAGMKQVMQHGTGAHLPSVAGVRMYGKTGTADAPGTADETAWGIKRGGTTSPHSWFVAIAEPSDQPECGTSGGRYVVAAVVPHGGFGATAAGPLAVDAVRALQENGYLPKPPPPSKK